MPTLKAKHSQRKASSELSFALELEKRGLFDEAERRLLSVLETQPKDWRVLHQLGAMYLARGDHARALEYLAAAMKANPASPEAKSNYGFILQGLERHEDALDYFKRALVAQPNYVPALLNRGASQYHLGRLIDALASFDRALALDPHNVKAHYNRANILHELRRFDDSLAAFAQTLRLAPDYADAQWNEGLTRLLLGDFERGWKQYEWRWKTESQAHLKRDFAQPLWLGAEPLSGKTILVHAEQGFGDMLQFARYLPRLAAQGADVILEAPPSLGPLLSNMRSVSRIVTHGEPLPDFDMHCPVMSLPLAFSTSLQTVPAEVPYLDVPGDRLEKWRDRLPPKKAFRVALAWAGSATHKQDQLRSIPFAKLAPVIAATENVEWLSVQRDMRAGDRELLATERNIRHLGEDLADFADTAAVLANADLVITVDTAIAHLAGALGRPVWILLQYSPDFRWLLERNDSPWYPTARLFRQPRPREWDEVIGSLAAALRSTLEISESGRDGSLA